MSAVKEMKDLLFEELDLIVRTSAGLIRRIQPEQWDYKPAPQMRTLKELVQHLVAIPSVDLLILQEKSQEEVRGLEAEFAAVTDKMRLAEWMEQGTYALKAYMNGLSDEQFLHKATKPFYLDHASVQAKWLIEIVTHAQHHRAQLFTYLKQSGHQVTMFDLY